MSAPTTSIGFSPTTPAADSGFQNAIPRGDGGSPLMRESFEVPNTGGAAAKTTSYTAIAADCGKLISFNSSGAVTLTLPNPVPFPQWNLGVQNLGGGTLTISVASGGTPPTIDGGSILNLAQFTGLQIATDGTNYLTERGAGASGGGGTYPGTGALSIASAASPSTVNLTTEGTFDWLCPNGNNGLPFTANTHMKKVSGTGFALAENFGWSAGTGGGTVFGSTNVVSPQASATASDDIVGVGLSSVVAAQGVFSSTAGALSYGFRLAVPAGQVSRTLRIYSSIFSGTATCTASLSDGSATTGTATISAGAGAGLDGYFTITFNAARDGQYLTVSVLLTTNLGSSPSVRFFAATLQ